MASKFLKKIIAKDQQGLNTISAICSESKIKIGDIIQNFDLDNSINTLTTYDEIQQYISINDRCIIKLGEGKHKIKKKAEQLACFMAINNIE